MKKELTRIFKAFGYSFDGFRAAWRDAGAFRTEIVLTPFIVALAFYFGHTHVQRGLLIGSWLLTVVVELLNTGIEAAVDLAAQGKIMPDAKKAKDAGSAAVFAACCLCGAVWICVLSP